MARTSSDGQRRISRGSEGAGEQVGEPAGSLSLPSPSVGDYALMKANRVPLMKREAHDAVAKRAKSILTGHLAQVARRPAGDVTADARGKKETSRVADRQRTCSVTYSNTDLDCLSVESGSYSTTGLAPLGSNTESSSSSPASAWRLSLSQGLSGALPTKSVTNATRPSS